MNLAVFAAELTKDLLTPQSKSAAKELLPQQQTYRSYKETETAAIPVKPMLIKYKFGEDRGRWIMRYYVQWPMGFKGYKTVSRQQMKKFAEEHLEAHSKRGEDKYIDITRADSTYIEYEWNIDKWMKASFKNPKYLFPISLEFKFKILIPHFIYVHAVMSDLSKFILRNFKIWTRSNKNKLKHRSFKFLKKVTPDIFEYELDIMRSRIKATIKYSVILGSLAIYTAFFHKKEIGKTKVKEVEKKASRISDVKRLDQYLKKIK